MRVEEAEVGEYLEPCEERVEAFAREKEVETGRVGVRVRVSVSVIHLGKDMRGKEKRGMEKKRREVTKREATTRVVTVQAYAEGEGEGGGGRKRTVEDSDHIVNSSNVFER